MWSKVSCLTRKKNNADVQVPTLPPKDKYTTVPLGRKTLVGHFLSHPIYTSIHPTEKTLLGKKYKYYLGKTIFEYQETKPSNKLIPAIFSEFQCVALFVVHTFHPTMFLHTDVYLKEIHLSQPSLISGFLKNPKGSNILFTCSTVASEGTKKGNENEAKELIYFISKFCSFIPQLIFAFR